ncbi:MAG: zf-HC2 domain-containing protein [Candidatus Dormibacteria bacterium]
MRFGRPCNRRAPSCAWCARWRTWTSGSADPGEIDCREADRLVRRFIAESLGGTERSAVLAHIAACPRCHERFDFEPQIRRLLAEAPDGGFDQAIRTHRDHPPED